jgi:hypothetical protein
MKPFGDGISINRSANRSIVDDKTLPCVVPRLQVAALLFSCRRGSMLDVRREKMKMVTAFKGPIY